MGSFLPPITTGNLAETIRTQLDATGHRTTLIAHITGSTLPVVAPVGGFVSLIADAGFAGELAVLSPTPAPQPQLRAVLTKLAGRFSAMPRFYIGASSLNPNVLGKMVAAGDDIASGSSLFIGATFGPCALAPREWGRLLVEAMAAAGETNLAEWATFHTLMGGDNEALYVLDHAGQVPEQMSFEVEFPSNNRVTLTTDASGDLCAASSQNLFVPGVRIRMVTDNGGIPFHSAFDSEGIRSSAEPNASDAERWFEPTEFGRQIGTLLCTDLNDWFGERPPGVSLQRYHTGNKVEPLLDGIETFQRLWDDMEPLRENPSTRGNTPYGLWLASWAFLDFELVPGTPESKFVDLINDLVDKDVSVRMLATKLLNFDGTETALERRLMVIAVILATVGIDFASVIALAIKHGISPEAWAIIRLLDMLIIIFTSAVFVDAISGAIDPSNDVMEKLTPSDNTPRFALWARYPARFSDNPETGQFGNALADIVSVERIGSWHNKMQMLAVPSATAGVPHYIGYLGGIDINTNRVDSWGHRWPPDENEDPPRDTPYHDVHARLTGPAVADLFQTFYERWVHEMPRVRDGEGPPAENNCPRFAARFPDVNTPWLSEIPRAGDHIVQIARTLYKPAAANANEALWFAPNGETSAHDSILRAIGAAREYIYIEDQFMVPPDCGTPHGPEIVEALEDAATRCKALIMVFPEGTFDKTWLFGVQRRNMLMRRLSLAWTAAGSQFLPMIHAWPMLPEAGRISSTGRTVVDRDFDHVDIQIIVKDGIRVPETPCWAWIAGELVLVGSKQLDTLSGKATLLVTRGPNGHHTDVWARAHKAGEPVTFSKIDDVFIHAKFMLVDDVFASIGSVNMNRRSMYHDGEISAQILPGRLRAAADNPVRDIRCRVWADHLGLEPDAAVAALADPLEALPLFTRKRAAGNPLVPYEVLDDMQMPGFPVDTEDPIQILGTIFGGLGHVGGNVAKHAVWSTLIDPTTSLDPFHNVPPFGP